MEVVRDVRFASVSDMYATERSAFYSVSKTPGSHGEQ